MRAGLALIDAVAALPAPEPLQVRDWDCHRDWWWSGILSGPAKRRSAVSSARRRTSRRACKASPSRTRSSLPRPPAGCSAISSSCEDLGPKDLKGIAGPVRAFAVLRASSVESRFEAMHPGGLTALVGREEELELLLRRWAKAKTGEGQVVLLSGEAGIGKSGSPPRSWRSIAAEPHTRLRYFCSPQHTDSALYPIIGQFERAAGFAHGDTPQTKLDKLDALLAQTSTSMAGRGALRRDVVASERRTLSRAGACSRTAPAENDGGAHRTNGSPGALKTRADDLRGCALERPHEPGSVRSHGGSDREPSACC